MKVIWSDGKVEEIADSTAEAVKDFLAYCRWFESLPKETQEAVKEDLQQHGWSDKAHSVSDEVPAMRAVLL